MNLSFFEVTQSMHCYYHFPNSFFPFLSLFSLPFYFTYYGPSPFKGLVDSPLAYAPMAFCSLSIYTSS